MEKPLVTQMSALNQIQCENKFSSSSIGTQYSTMSVFVYSFDIAQKSGFVISLTYAKSVQCVIIGLRHVKGSVLVIMQTIVMSGNDFLNRNFVVVWDHE